MSCAHAKIIERPSPSDMEKMSTFFVPHYNATGGRGRDSMRVKRIAIGIMVMLLCWLFFTACSKDDSGHKASAEDALSAAITSPVQNMIVNEGQSVTFQGTAKNGTAPYTYQWEFSGVISDSNEQNPGPVRFDTRGTYTITLVIKDAKKAEASDTRTIIVQSSRIDTWHLLSAGENHTLAIKPDGTLWAWGYNAYGQLGDGTWTNRATPVQIGTERDWVAVSAGTQVSFGIKSDGTLWAWGSSASLGTGSYSDSNVPSQIASDRGWSAVSAGRGGFVLAIKSDGTLWSWGDNFYGQLGDGSQINRRLPEQVGTDTNWIAASAGMGHSAALKTDGTIWEWGTKYSPPPGYSSWFIDTTPVRVGMDTDWVSISTSGDHTLAIKTDGSLWAWGNNWAGQLGDNTLISKSTPQQITTTTGWTAVNAASDYSIALKSDGTIWAWGTNYYGQLGDGTGTDRKIPTQVGADNDWSMVNATYTHTVAFKSDGSFWTWGSNWSDQLGNGMIGNLSAPGKIDF